MAKNKQVTIDALLKLNTDTSSFDSIRTKLIKVFNNANVDKKFADSILKQFDIIQKRGKDLFNFQFNPNDSKITKTLAGELNKYEKELNAFISNISSATAQDALLPVKGIENDLKHLEATFGKTINNLKQGFKEATGKKYDNFTGMSGAELQKINSAIEYHNANLKIQKAEMNDITQSIDAQNAKLDEQQKWYSVLNNMKSSANNPEDIANINKSLEAANLEIEQTKKGLKELDIAKQRQEGKIDKSTSGITQNEKLLEIAKQSDAIHEKTTEKINKENAAYQKQVQILTDRKSKLMSERGQYGGFSSKEVQETVDSMANFNDNVKIAADGIDEQAESAKQAGLKNNYFARQLAMVTSAAYLMSKAFEGLRAAVRTVSDLDDAMTGIAVVTNQTREQVWGNYEAFQGLADRLNTTTQNIAEAALLYYQQGLKTSEVMEVVESTTIAATLAGIDFAEASERMTAALRGFDLEMSDSLSVTDTFSSLAAYTAADFNELSYALTKTASIAHTANMSLENTSAFLAKMIETTREAPENLGTAMKSIIARMAELKTAPAKALEDGTDLNKVHAALRSVNIELLNSKNEMRAFDDVLIELGNKWQYVDRNTQSYLATVIAGNRQQSRFLSLMSDFGRTMEMVEMANNAAGDSTAMFNTYITGVEASTNRLTQAQQNLANAYLKSEWIIGFKDGLAGALGILSQMPPTLTILSMAMTGIAIAVTKAKVAQSLFNGSASLSTKIMKLWTAETIRAKVTEEASNAATLKNTVLTSANTIARKVNSLANLSSATTFKIVAASALSAGAGIATMTANIVAASIATMVAVAPYLLIIAAIGGIITAIYKLATAKKREIEATKEQITVSNERAESAKQEMTDLKHLGERYDELSAKIGRTAEEQKEFIELQQTLAEKFPELVSGFDEYGNALITNGKKLAEALEVATEEELEAYRDNRRTAIEGEIKLRLDGEWSEEVKSLQKDLDDAIRDQAKSGKPIYGGMSSGYNITAKDFIKGQSGINDIPIGMGLDKIGVENTSEAITKRDELNKKKFAELTKTYKTFANDITNTLSNQLNSGSKEVDDAVKSLLIPFGHEYVDSVATQYNGDVDAFLKDGSKLITDELEKTMAQVSKILTDGRVDGQNLGVYINDLLASYQDKSLESIRKDTTDITDDINNAFEEAVKSSNLSDKNIGLFSQKKTVEEKKKFLEIISDTEPEAAAILKAWNLEVEIIPTFKADQEAMYADIKKIFSKNNILNESFSEYGSKIGASSLQAIRDNLVELQDDPAAVQAASASFDKLFAGLSEDKYAEVETLFNNLDTRSADSLASFRDSLIKSELVSVDTADSIVTALSQIDKITFDNISNSLAAVVDKNKTIGEYTTEAMTTGGFTADQIKELINLYPQLAGKFAESTTEAGRFKISLVELAEVQRNNVKTAIDSQKYSLAELTQQTKEAKEEFVKNYNQIHDKDITAYEDYTGVIEDLDESLKTNIATIQDSEKAQADANVVLAETQQLYSEIYNDAISAAIERIETLAQKQDILIQSEKELKESGTLTAGSLQSMIDNNLLQYLSTADGKLQIVAEATQLLENAARNEAIATLQAAATTDIAAYANGNLAEMSGFARQALLDAGVQADTTSSQFANLTDNALAGSLALATWQQQNGEDPGEKMAGIEAIAKAYDGLGGVISKFTIAGGSANDTLTSSTDKNSKATAIQIDKFYKLKTAIEGVDRQLAKNEKLQQYYKDDIVKTNLLLKNKVDLMLKEQSLLGQLNDGRRKEIDSNIKQLKAWGFQIEYNKNENEFLVVNMDKLQGASGDLAESQQDLIEATKKLNDENSNASDKWRDLGTSIKETKKEFKDLVNEFKNSEIEQIGWLVDDINHAKSNDSKLERWGDQIEDLEAQKDLLSGTSDKLAEINEQILKQKQLIKDLTNEKNKAVYDEAEGWVWSNDAQAIQDAQEELTNLEKEREELKIDTEIERIQALIDKREKMYQDSLDDLQKIQDNLSHEVDSSNREIKMSYSDLKKAMGIWGVDSVKNLAIVQTAFEATTAAIKNAVAGLDGELKMSVPTPSGGGSSGGGSGGGGSSKKNNSTATIPGIGTVPISISGGRTQTADLPKGTIVHTAGGDFTVTGGNAGSYTSRPSTKQESDWAKKKKTYDKGGTATGKGLLSKQINETETMLGPDISKMILDPQKSREFESFIRGITTLFDGGFDLSQFENNNLDLLGDVSRLTQGIESNGTSGDTTVKNYFDKIVLPNVTDGNSFVHELSLLKNIVTTNSNTIY